MRRIVMLAYGGAQILDIAGPLEVFAAASRVLAEESAEGAVSGGYRDESAQLRERFRGVVTVQSNHQEETA